MARNRAVQLRVPGREPSDVMTETGHQLLQEDCVKPALRRDLLEQFQSRGRALPSGSHYELGPLLGEGGMGAVYRADHVSAGGIRKQVAIKVLKETADRQAIARFVQEAQLLAQLAQGTVVELLALEQTEITLPARRDPKRGGVSPSETLRLTFMVQEFVNGPSLEGVLGKATLGGVLFDPPMVGFILNKTAIALAEAHALLDEEGRPLGLAHCDISPSNILLNRKAGITKLADFGVAEAFSHQTAKEALRIVGKPRYMAPEQLLGRACPASDIWALGVIGFECLTGFPPYRPRGETLGDKIASLQAEHQRRLLSPAEILRHAPRERFPFETLSEIVMACLAPEPADRPTSQEMTARLEGEYLYGRGLGPTNKTLAAYLRLLEGLTVEGATLDEEENRTLQKTLDLETLEVALPPRRTSRYAPTFVQAVQSGAANPCLV